MLKWLPLALVLLATPACASIHGSAPSPNIPVLANTVISVGNLTQTTHSNVRLSSGFADSGNLGLLTSLGTGSLGNMTWTVAYSSCSIISGSGSCSASDWTLIGVGTAEGTTAILPTPSSTGVTNCLGGGASCAGTAQYVFSVSSSNLSGSSATKTLTINTVAGAANWGNETDSGVTAGTFQSKGGTAILLATGADRGGWSGASLNASCIGTPGSFSCRGLPGGVTFLGTSANCYIVTTMLTCPSGYATTGTGFLAGQYFIGDDSVTDTQTTALSTIVSNNGDSTCASGCTITPSQTFAGSGAPALVFTGVSYHYADAARPTPTIDWEYRSGTHYLITDNITINQTYGAGVTQPGSWFKTAASSTFMGWNNPTVINADVVNPTSSTSTVFSCGGATNVIVNGLVGTYIAEGVVESSVGPCTNVSIANAKIRYYSNNAIFMGSGSNWTFHDTLVASPKTGSAGNAGFHVDMLQLANYTGPQNLKLLRTIWNDADGGNSLGTQAPIFQGANQPWVVNGFVDDGLGGGSYDAVAGNVLTVTSVLVQNISSTLTNGAISGSTLTFSSNAGNGIVIGSIIKGAGISYPCNMTVKLSGTSYTVSGAGCPSSLAAESISVIAQGADGNMWLISTPLAGTSLTGAPHPTAGPCMPTVCAGQTSSSGSASYDVGTYTLSGGAQAVPPTIIHTYYASGLVVNGLLSVGCSVEGPFQPSSVNVAWSNLTYFHANTAGFTSQNCATSGPSIQYVTPTNTGSNMPYDGSSAFSSTYFSGSQGTFPSTFSAPSNAYFANGANGTTDPACTTLCDFMSPTPKATLQAFNWAAASNAAIISEMATVLTPNCTSGTHIYPVATPYAALNCSGKWNDGSNITPH